MADLTFDTIPLKNKDEEKVPLISTQINKDADDDTVTITTTSSSGEDGDDEDDDGNQNIDFFSSFKHKSQNFDILSVGSDSNMTTNCQTMMHLLKGNIGTGILAMPSAFANAGLFVGSLALPIMGIICIHCMHMLLSCNEIICQRFGFRQLDYEEVAEKSFLIGPKSLRRYANHAKTAVSTFLLITQFGFCCVYAIFVSENLKTVIEGLSRGKIDFNIYFYMLMLLPFFILLNFIKSLKHLSLASAIANLLQCTGLCVVFYNLVQGLPDITQRPAYVDFRRFPLYMGTAIYAFEGIGLVLPLQKVMREPQAFGGSCGVLNTGMVIVSSLYIGMGFFGYLKFGEAVKGSITLNLPSEPIYQTCQLMFATAIFLSYAIQFYVPFNIIWPWVQNKFLLIDNSTRTRSIELGLRALLVIGTFGLAASIPRLDLFISLVGALSSSCLALIFPPIMQVLTLWDEQKSVGSWTWILVKNSIIFLIGILGFFTGTYASLKEIVDAFTR